MIVIPVKCIKSMKLVLLNPSGTKDFGTYTKHQGGIKMDPPSISRMTNATNLKPWEVLTLFDMRGHNGLPKMFLTTSPIRLGGGS